MHKAESKISKDDKDVIVSYSTRTVSQKSFSEQQFLEVKHYE